MRGKYVLCVCVCVCMYVYVCLQGTDQLLQAFGGH